MKTTSVILIAAMSENRVIGRKGKIPWDIPEDREFFKKSTMGHVIVLGRRSYEEIGHALPGREMIVVSRTLCQKKLSAEVTVLPSLEMALAYAEKNFSKKKIFLCGGAGIYREGMEIATDIYLTKVKQEVEGDTYFPFISDAFTLKEEKQGKQCSFLFYQRS